MPDNRRCFPPHDFVQVLCQKKYPGVALAMFSKNAPWQHGFVKVADVAPLNSVGGPSGDARLEFLEEVLVLREREFKSGDMEMSAPPKSYDVLRFDGTCATLAADEFMWNRPGVRVRYAPIVWRQIDAGMRQTLTQNSRVDQAREGQYVACRGSFLAGGGAACRDATQQLARAIVAELNRGLDLPTPEGLPEWSAAQPSLAAQTRGRGR